MLLGGLPRASRKRLLRFGLLGFLVFNLFDVFLVRRYQKQAPRLLQTQAGDEAPYGRVFLSAIHWNSEKILSSHWNQALVSLAEALGPENIFVSIYESGSWDNTKGVLKELDTRLEKLGVSKHIELDPTTHFDEVSRPPASTGWVDNPRGKKELRRIPYLAKLRNWSLRPLDLLNDQGHSYDRILFLNDVVFTVDDVLTLLSTNGGKYAAACSLDFSDPPNFYDTFALRDSEGHEAIMPTWPYFRSRASRNAIKHNQPVPVTSCWNGIVAMDAKPFYANPPLAFRAIPDSLASRHFEASECCLIHADNPLSRAPGVWLNPAVRVGYNATAYAAVHAAGGAWPSAAAVARGLWENRLRRWFSTERFKEKALDEQVEKWVDHGPDETESWHRAEEGRFCIVDEMQVLVANGWVHL